MSGCHKNNIKFDNDLKYDKSMGWPTDILFDSIKKYPENKKFFDDEEWNSSNIFYRKSTCNTDFPLYIDYSYLYPNAKDVAKQIREAGGKVFLAHLFFYPIKNHMEFLDILRKEKLIDGVEVYYPSFTAEQIALLENYCQKYNLYMSAGTDCHGKRTPHRRIGIGHGDMNIARKVIKNWC